LKLFQSQGWGRLAGGQWLRELPLLILHKIIFKNFTYHKTPAFNFSFQFLKFVLSFNKKAEKMLFNTDGKFKDLGILIIRIGLGLSYIFIHGGKKILGGPEGWANTGKAISNFGIQFMPAFWGFMAAFAETFGGLLMIVGLFFRPAAALIIITMIVAASNHIAKGDPFARAAYPIELMIVFIGLLFIGAGKYSLDELISKKKTTK